MFMTPFEVDSRFPAPRVNELSQCSPHNALDSDEQGACRLLFVKHYPPYWGALSFVMSRSLGEQRLALKWK
jgi:hypothetical protein